MPTALTLGDLKNSGIPARINMCKEDPRFAESVNRLIRWLMLHGDFNGLVRPVEFCVDDACFTTPACVATINSVNNGCRAVDIKNNWYDFIPYSPAPSGRCGTQIFKAVDTIPTARTLREPGILRTFISSPHDVGKKITYLGHDWNGIWIRTETDTEGVLQDGETVTLKYPFVDTVTMFSSVTSTLKDETQDRVTVFSHPSENSHLTSLAVYEYWETRPIYQRYSLPEFKGNSHCSCNGTTDTGHCPRLAISALVKLEFVPVKNDNDFLLISNLPALELGLEALKAKDDGDLAKCDVLLYGNAQNKRLGALPMLQHEIQTYTADRFTGRVSLFGTAPLRRKFAGFI